MSEQRTLLAFNHKDKCVFVESNNKDVNRFATAFADKTNLQVSSKFELTSKLIRENGKIKKVEMLPYVHSRTDYHQMVESFLYKVGESIKDLDIMDELFKDETEDFTTLEFLVSQNSFVEPLIVINFQDKGYPSRYVFLHSDHRLDTSLTPHFMTCPNDAKQALLKMGSRNIIINYITDLIELDEVINVAQFEHELNEREVEHNLSLFPKNAKISFTKPSIYKIF